MEPPCLALQYLQPKCTHNRLHKNPQKDDAANNVLKSTASDDQKSFSKSPFLDVVLFIKQMPAFWLSLQFNLDKIQSVFW